MEARDNLKTDDTFKVSCDQEEIRIGARCFLAELGGWMTWTGSDWKLTQDYNPEVKD